MTRAQFDALDSDGRVACPDCGGTRTTPFPNCGCPREPLSLDARSGIGLEQRSAVAPYVTRHINLYHHVCRGETARTA